MDFSSVAALPLIPPFREGGFVLPATIGPEPRRQCVEAALAACRVPGLRNGWTHTEIKLTVQGPAIIEVNGRLSGYVALLMRRAARIAAVSLALDIAAGRPHPVPAASYERTAYAAQLMPPMEACRLTSLGDVSRLNTHPDVDMVILITRPGKRVDWRHGSDDLVGLVEGTADDHDAVVAVVRDVRVWAARELEFV